MLFNSVEFLCFFLGVVLLYKVWPKSLFSLFWVAASYLFYAAWDYRFLGLILSSTLVDYLAGRYIGRSPSKTRKRAALIFSLVFNLSLLGFFKYFHFFVDSLYALLSTFGLQLSPITLHIILPVGISFYTFQTMSYTIDVYKGRIKPESNFLRFAAFVAFFPQLVAGPIERAEHLLPQLALRENRRPLTLKQPLWLILWGFFLKVFMADNLSVVVDAYYQNIENASGWDAWIVHYAFAFQILGDFAGYSYMAIGLALIFGIKLHDNFFFPYFTDNPKDFWKNWHVTLSSWLRDYLYIPMGGNRKGKNRQRLYLMITMLLGGLWHGAAWNFVLWGFYHGFLLIIYHSLEKRWPQKIPKIPVFLKILFFFHLTCIGWMLFRARSLRDIGHMFQAIATDYGTVNWQTAHWAMTTLFYTALPLFLLLRQYRRGANRDIPFSNPYSRIALVVALVYLLFIFGRWTSEQFIYFQF